MGQLLRIAVEVEQLRDSVRLAQRRVNVDMAVTAPRSEVLSLQFAERNNLNDRLSMGPRLDRQLVASRFTEDYDMTLALATDQELLFLTRDLHRIQRFMRFNCVGNALSEFIPDFEGVIEA